MCAPKSFLKKQKKVCLEIPKKENKTKKSILKQSKIS